MTQRIPLVVLIASAMLAGCTPPDENIARRYSTGAMADDQAKSGQYLQRMENNTNVDPATRAIVGKYGTTIRQCAQQYGFDWRFILAVMKQESRFEADAESHKGATGLMQVMPLTQREIADQLDLGDSVRPTSNIRIGVYYLRKLYGMFDGVGEADRLKLTLASYNAGPGRVYDAQEVAAYLGDNPTQWQAVKESLPFLSRRFATLHRHVWPQQRPHNGWFGGARQTVAYVDSVMSHYETYRRDFN